jgi:hypothetical protein
MTTASFKATPSAFRTSRSGIDPTTQHQGPTGEIIVLPTTDCPWVTAINARPVPTMGVSVTPLD